MTTTPIKPSMRAAGECCIIAGHLPAAAPTWGRSLNVHSTTKYPRVGRQTGARLTAPVRDFSDRQVVEARVTSAGEILRVRGLTRPCGARLARFVRSGRALNTRGADVCRS